MSSFTFKLFVAVLLFWGTLQGQTSLSSGDMALLGMDTPGEDFAFVCFVDLAEGTEIYFTDEEANGVYTIGTGEGTVLYTAPAGGLAKGTVVTYKGDSDDFTTTSDGTMALGNSGDGILAYQGGSVGNVTTFLHAIGEDAGDIGTFPDGFSNYMTFGADDGEYDGTRTGTAAALMEAINDNSNWTTSGSGVIPFTTTSFTISGGGGNSLPSISDIARTPSGVVQSSNTVSVSATITDSDGTIEGAELHWGTSSGSLGTTIGMSNSDGDTYTTDSDIPSQSDGTTVYFEIYALDNDAGESTTAEQSYSITDPATTTIPYSEAFASDLGDCYTYSVSGDSKVWTYDGDGNFAYMNGYNSGDTEEDWLVLPGINFDNYSGEVISFDTYYQYNEPDADNYLKLMYSTNYTGIGDPSSAAWTELAFTQPASQSSWQTSGNVDLSAISGTAYLALKYRGTSGSYILWQVDNIAIQTANVADPASFAATAASSSQINLTFATNVASDNVVIVFDTDNTFSDPAGAPPAQGEAFAGGTLLYNGTTSPYNHTSLSGNATYYYKAWSYDNPNYSAGVTANASTPKVEPTNHAASFTVSASSYTQVDFTWSDNDGAQAADAFLIKISATNLGAISDPVDGTAEADDTDLSDGSGVVNVNHGTEEYSLSGLDAETTYYAKIYPYTNSGSEIDFKTDGSVPEGSDTTPEEPSTPTLVITEIMQNPADVNDGDGEWFEIYNDGDATVDINGYVLKDAGSDSHTINNGGSLNIEAGAFLVLGINANTSTNGGVTVDYEYSGFTLSNGADEIILYMSNGTTEIDRVEYDGGTQFPDPSGASMVLKNIKGTNNNGQRWTTSTTREGNYASNGNTDKGSPGALGEYAMVPTLKSVGAGSNVNVSVGNGTAVNSIVFENVTGGGSLSVGNYNNAPANQGGISGNVLNYRWVIENTDVTFDTYTIRFDLADMGAQGITEGDDGIHLYKRETEGSGDFTDFGVMTYHDNGTAGDQSDDYLTLSGISSFSEFSLSSPNSPMPVEMTSFSAAVSNGIVTLNWSTATETENYGFEIERSSDNRAWNKIGFINGSGNSNSVKAYSFTDETIKEAGTYYYRLKQVDNDGSFESSEVIETMVELPQDYSLEQNFPNPFNPSTNISFTIPEKTEVKLAVFNLLGELVTEIVSGNLEAGYYNYSFDATGLTSGIYLYKLETASFSQTRKMILVK